MGDGRKFYKNSRNLKKKLIGKKLNKKALLKLKKEQEENSKVSKALRKIFEDLVPKSHPQFSFFRKILQQFSSDPDDLSCVGE